ncbi:YceI family protein [Erythrobacter litoralis]|uniref:Lipid/polyisoprenoid-binding YceI-like domain-containing protein n=1 Tax=Erythrobacter litoralis (strain HTCC2594) TaxID=314225 RepID=Q2NC03_ERYLH|nr:YceI family protein [Erythrobacter litoralis]ABC62788.1 hypothetical protein ELI_03480 [Erythrobacter litoralis HTCC2594]
MLTGRAFLASLCAVLLGAASPAGTTYAVDAAASSVSAKVPFLGFGSKTAGFPDLAGTIRLSPDDPRRIDLDVRLNARALTAPDNLTRERLRGEKFFWVEKYPTVRFKGRRMVLRDARSGTVEGTLTARGVSQPVTLQVAFDTPPGTVAPGQPLTLTGETRIDRRDFGMTAYSLIVGKTVTIRLKARLRPVA